MSNNKINPAKASSGKHIVVKGASEHNLKNVSVKLPREALVVLSGVSGSGKSSLAFDTIFKEGQRRFLESLSPYARQFLGGMEKPRVEQVEGLSATISIDQKTVNRNPRSTVGTVTELYDHYRLLMARLGKPHCPNCGVAVASLGAEQIVNRLLVRYEEAGLAGQKSAGLAGQKAAVASALLLAPMVRERKGEYRKELKQWQEEGYLRVRVDGTVRRLDEKFQLERYEKHSLELVLDRLPLNKGMRSRWVEGVEKCLELSGGLVGVLLEQPNAKREGQAGSSPELFSSELACPKCQTAIPELEPRLFSFNDAQGACPVCGGMGERQEYHHELLMDGQKSLRKGALRCLNSKKRLVLTALELTDLCRVATKMGLDVDQPWQSLNPSLQQQFLEGDGGSWLLPRQLFRPSAMVAKACAGGRWPGIIGILRVLERFRIKGMLDRYQSLEVCPACNGGRLSKAALAVMFQGENMASLTAMSLTAAQQFFAQLVLADEQAQIGKDILREVRSRLDFLCQVGVGYLTVARKTNTLSGGESQRIRLASQVGSRLQGVLYVLDEPSIGLHAVDQQRLLTSLQKLKELGNSLCVVEHDAATMAAADYLVDMGPGAGSQGGEILAEGTLAQVMRSRSSISAKYLRGEMAVPKPAKRRVAKQHLIIKEANHHNLKQLSVKLPLAVFCAVSGVSGSGKSTFVHQILKESIRAHLNGIGLVRQVKIEGLDQISKVIEINQTPIGRTPRSNAATYTKLLDVIRDLFTKTHLARMRGYKAGQFSFNVKGGRCEVCQGAGMRVVEMQFLSDVEVICEACQGRRFNQETLQVRYKQQHIQAVLNMTVAEAAIFFASQPEAKRILDSLVAVGLGYLVLGQSSTTLSGGEAQRLKLASELRKKPGLHTLYLLDEPTTGLHAKDVFSLLTCLHQMVDAGHSVVVIEHNLDVLKSADWILDLGPGGGDKGGELVVAGTPEEVVAERQSLTGQALKSVLRSVAPLGDWKPQPQKLTKKRPPPRDLLVWGAENNNLKNIDVRIPKNKLTVITGVSGSGKSSLALGTLFAEGQARYVESLSTYARRFLGRMDKARVRSIEGLSPAIAIDQKYSTRNPRSTVATATEIYDYLRLIYARLGQAHCPICQVPLKAYPPTQLAEYLSQQLAGQSLLICAPLVHPSTAHSFSKAALKKRLATCQAEGFTRIWQQGSAKLSEIAQYQPQTKQLDNLHILIDRLHYNASQKGRLSESISTAYQQSGGLVSLVGWELPASNKQENQSKSTRKSSQKDKPELSKTELSKTELSKTELSKTEPLLFSEESACLTDNVFMSALSPRQFSFNSPHGACPACEGLGNTTQLDWDRWVANPHKPLFKGALRPNALNTWFNNTRSNWQRGAKLIAKRHNIRLTLAAGKLSSEERRLLLAGDGQLVGLNTLLSQKLAYANQSHKNAAAEIMKLASCSTCKGTRLMPLARHVLWQKMNIAQFCQQTVSQALLQLEQWQLSQAETIIVEQPLQEIRSRLTFLVNVGLGHLQLERPAATLSGGEAQRIRLASQLGAQLVGVLYVLDEPTIGLHARDTQRLLDTLRQLKELGNTICVVEHDSQVIKSADHVVDIGPAAGRYGGQLVAQGTPKQIAKQPTSITGQYLSGRLSIALPSKTRQAQGLLKLENVCIHNLKNLKTSLPLKCFVAISGVSGSGKSTLVHQVLVPLLQKQLQAQAQPQKQLQAQSQLETKFDSLSERGSLSGFQSIKRMLVVNQAPIGRTPKSNPATYLGLMTHIRNLFATMPQARTRGWKAGRFSFNMPQGRCPICEGRGFHHIEMHFLADVWTKCSECKGQRYNQQTLEILFKGHNIAAILKLEVQEALELFTNQPPIKRALQTLIDVGLGYIQLGQPANTLSGGEAQRLKLAAELNKSHHLHTLYLFDEPTTGLHSDDVSKLLVTVHKLVDQGHSVIVIEHNPEVLKTADFILDMGPEEGSRGGKVVALTTPRKLCEVPLSHTGQALKPFFV